MINTSKRPTACFAGTRLEAMQALKRFTKVTSVVTPKGSWVYDYCKTKRIPMQLVDKKRKDQVIRFLSERSETLVLSAGFPFVLPSYVLSKGATFINSHPSLLPNYRGYNAIKDALKNGDEYLGVTVHHMVGEVDAGEIICQERVWIKGLDLQEIYALLFGVVEPMAITKALEVFIRKHGLPENAKDS
jgi:phosphoribosylglycinamide formyltransferase-1